MSSILYYSNFCENSKNLLSSISKSSVKNDLHFICIDKRIQKDNNTYIVLENNQQIVLPNTITAVPALLLINNNYQVLFGSDIVQHLKPVEEVKTQQATNFNGEPSAFNFNGGVSGVVSDVVSGVVLLSPVMRGWSPLSRNYLMECFDLSSPSNHDNFVHIFFVMIVETAATKASFLQLG